MLDTTATCQSRLYNGTTCRLPATGAYVSTFADGTPAGDPEPACDRHRLSDEALAAADARRPVPAPATMTLTITLAQADALRNAVIERAADKAALNRPDAEIDPLLALARLIRESIIEQRP